MNATIKDSQLTGLLLDSVQRHQQVLSGLDLKSEHMWIGVCLATQEGILLVDGVVCTAQSTGKRGIVPVVEVVIRAIVDCGLKKYVLCISHAQKQGGGRKGLDSPLSGIQGY